MLGGTLQYTPTLGPYSRVDSSEHKRQEGLASERSHPAAIPPVPSYRRALCPACRRIRPTVGPYALPPSPAEHKRQAGLVSERSPPSPYSRTLQYTPP